MADKSGAGLRERFEKLLGEHSGRVLTLALRITGDASTAHDVSQEVFLAVWRSFAASKVDTNWPAYLHAATVREALRQMRSRRPGDADAEAVADAPSRSPEARALGSELTEAVRRGLARLPDTQSMAFVLSRLQGLSYRDCAAAIGCSEDAARTHAHRAALALAGMLREHAPSAGRGRTNRPDKAEVDDERM